MAHILVVDDDPEIRDTLRRLLVLAGHSVEVASDGLEARRRLEEESFDLLLTDVVMPDQDGLGLIQETRRAWPGVRIIAASGGGLGRADEYLKVARLLGARSLLQKPFNHQDILDTVQEVLTV